jgi:hypothetical protein
MSLCLLQILSIPCRPLLAYCNVSGNINWSYGINWINGSVIVSLELLKGEKVLSLLSSRCQSPSEILWIF